MVPQDEQGHAICQSWALSSLAFHSLILKRLLSDGLVS
jgi:hypothetical protein